MRQFLKKRVPTFLLTLVMVMTMVPAVSAKSSDITYSVKPGDSATFSVSDFSDYYDKYCSGTFEHVEFSVSRSDYSDFEGSVAYRGDNLSRADLVGSKFYDTSSDFDPDSDSYPLKRLSLVADSSASTSTLEISFTAYGTRSNGRTDSVDGTLSLEVSKSGSTSSKGDIVYEVKAGDEVSFSGRDFEKYFDKYCDGTFRYVEFDRPNSSDYADGYIYFRHGKTREDYFTRTQLSGTKFYYSDSDYGDYDLDELSFVADKSFSGPITLSFTVYGGSGTKTNRSETGTLVINASGKSTSSKGDITYEVKAGDEVSFSGRDFEKYFDKYCDGTFRYVEFARPNSSDYADGYIYFRHGKTREDYFSRTQLSGTKFYYDDSDYGDYDLDELSFVADKSFSGPVTLSFTVYGGSGTKTNRSETGTLVINASGSSSGSTTKGDVTYTVKAGSEVSFDEDDFQKVYDKSSCTGTFKYVAFDRPSTSDYAKGTLYSKYGARKEVAFTRSDISGTTFGYSSYDGDVDYNLSDLSFVADKTFTSGSITLSFTLYGGSGSRTNQSTTGTLTITSGKSSSSSTTKGDITYTVKAGSEVSFDEDDFQKVYDKSSCTGTFKYVAFDRPSTSDYAKGTLYSKYGARKEVAFTRSDISGTTFGYSSYDGDVDYNLSDLSFVADKTFTSGSITLTFTLYGGSGSRTNQSTTGTLVITTGSSSSTSYYAGNIRYSTTTGTALQINANDFARYFKKIYSSGNLAYVTISGVPSTGSLYYNYYGTSQFGATSRTQLTASSVSGKVFSYSPSAKTEYALSELTYIPSGTNYCTALSFNAYGTNGQSAAGTILISVNAKAIPEVYSVATKGTSVTFPASSISAAVASVTGTNLSGIQLLDLPSTTSGVVYAGSAAAGTTTNYSYSSMSQLRFVPNSNFTGSVSIPYVALNSNGVAFAAGTFSIGVVSSVKKFSDVTTSTWCYKYVTELSGSNIISGYSNGSFQEKNTITYGAALKLIMLAAGYGEQTPTVKGSTFSGYLAKAKADGLVTGNPKLNGSITRLQIAQIASKALKLSTTNLSNKKPFTDTNDVYVQALNAAGIIEGYFSNGTSTYKPNNTLTRGQVSAIVWRMRNYGK